MVANLQNSPDSSGRNNGVPLPDSPVTKAMSESVPTPTHHEKYEEGERESESVSEAESDDEKEDNVSAEEESTKSGPVVVSEPPQPGIQTQSSSSSPHPRVSSSKSKKRSGGSHKNNHTSAKGESVQLVRGSTSESSINKTTPDSSLETQSSNTESVEVKRAGKSEEVKGKSVKTGVSPSSKCEPQPSSSTNNPSSSSLNSSSKKRSVSSPKGIDRGGLGPGPLNIRALPFESGINTECIQLLRQLWNVHEEALHFLTEVHLGLTNFRKWFHIEDNEFEGTQWDKKRLSSCSAVQLDQRRTFGGKGEQGEGVQSESGNDVRWVPLQRFVDGLKCVSDNISDIEKQCLTLSVFQSQCKLVLYAKIRHAKRQVTHDRLVILHGISKLLTVATQLLASPSFWQSSETEIVMTQACSLFQLCETYNVCLESCWSHVEACLSAANPSLASTPSDADSGTEMGATATPSKIRVLAQVKAANTNDAPFVKQSLKPMSATKILQLIAQRRATFAASEFTRIALDVFYKNQEEVISVDKFQQVLDDETKHLNPVEKAFAKKPSILGRAAVKEAENGEYRLTKSFKMKMYGYFHEVLWSLVGECSEDLVLWSLQTAVPLTLQSSEMQIQLRKVLKMGAHTEAASSSPLLSAFEAIGNALHSFSLMVNWDEKMREAFEMSFRVKRPEHVSLVSKPQPSQMATEVGRKFGEVSASCISLMEAGNSVTSRMLLPLAERQKLAMSSEEEEEPIGDEAQILFRLEATLNYLRAWTVRRSKVWLNSWAVPQFIACSQRDPAILVQMIKSKEVFLVTREALLRSENVAIGISARNRQTCADDMRKAILNLQKVPEELLRAVGIVCRTLSLATLQTYMPDAAHWKGMGKGSGLDRDAPSPYVRIFIDRVVSPVFKAAVNLVPPLAQEALGKQVINAMCDAWLHYILQKKIKFSEWGAVQLLRDFVSLREWIRSETQLDKEARKAILQLEILKSCEGVAYLLLRNPGDVLGVGKPSRKSRRVAPTSSAGSIESSPSASEASTAEDDIPPEMYVPNQQMWLQLRLKKTGFAACCNF